MDFCWAAGIEGAGLIAEFESAGVGELNIVICFGWFGRREFWLSFLANGLVGFINSTSSRFRSHLLVESVIFVGWKHVRIRGVDAMSDAIYWDEGGFQGRRCDGLCKSRYHLCQMVSLEINTFIEMTDVSHIFKSHVFFVSCFRSEMVQHQRVHWQLFHGTSAVDVAGGHSYLCSFGLVFG